MSQSPEIKSGIPIFGRLIDAVKGALNRFGKKEVKQSPLPPVAAPVIRSGEKRQNVLPLWIKNALPSDNLPPVEALKDCARKLIPTNDEQRKIVSVMRVASAAAAENNLTVLEKAQTTLGEFNAVAGVSELAHYVEGARQEVRAKLALEQAVDSSVKTQPDIRSDNLSPAADAVSVEDPEIAAVMQNIENGDQGPDQITSARARLLQMDRELVDGLKGMLPNRTGFTPSVEAMRAKHSQINKELNRLAEMSPEVQQRGKEFAQTYRSVHKQINDFDEFKKRVDLAYKRPGVLDELFKNDPDIGQHLARPENFRSRDYLFDKILYNVLNQRNRDSRELFDLYERSDMSTFMRFIGQLDQPQYTSPGGMREKPLGGILVNYYDALQDAIFQSHDTDYWAAHGAGDIRQFQNATFLYKNEYGELAANDPAINAAMRAYEMALLHIRDSHNGYIPPAAIGYDPTNETFYWDDLAEDIFKEFLANGSIPRVARDPRSGLALPLKENGLLTIDRNNPLNTQDLDELEIKKIMKLAKGFGIISVRLLEIFANSRGPGSDHTQFGAGGFHSIPYEGIARYMQPMVHLFTKWKFGNDIHSAFFQQVLDPKGPVWTSQDMVKIREAAIEGRLEEKFGEGAQRLIDVDNLNNFSGAFGPWTKWRIKDSILGWNDRDKEALGGGLRLSLAKDWAEEKVKERIKTLPGGKKIEANIENPQGWARMKDQNHDLHSIGIQGDYQKYIESHHHDALAQKLARAHNAYVWLQMVERNPILIARNLVLEKRKMPNEKTYDWTLRHKIVNDVLGINLLDDDFTLNKTPTDASRRKLKAIILMEADVAAVRERLINLEISRPVEERDFTEVIKNRYVDPENGLPGAVGNLTADERVDRAKRYWDIVHTEMTGHGMGWGTPNLLHTQDMLDELGIANFTPDGKFRLNDADWKKIENIDNIVHHHHNLATLVHKEWNWLPATDDTSWRQLDLLNLGARQWIRRSGDLASHAAGIDLQTKYLGSVLTPKAEMRDLVKALQEMRDAFAGDDISVGWKAGYVFALGTGRLFEAPWWADIGPTKLLLSGVKNASVMERLFGKMHAHHWTANERRRWSDMILEGRVVPPNELDIFGRRYPFNAHKLQKELRGTDFQVIVEIVTLGILAALIFTALAAIYKGITEEEEKAHQ